MGLQRKFSIYKYVKLGGKWRYCVAAASANHRIKSHVVLVGEGGERHEEKHPEGAYYLHARGQWIPAGKTAKEAQESQARMLAKQQYEKITGRRLYPEAEGMDGEGRELLAGAVESYLDGLAQKVSSHNRRPKTLAANRLALHEFVEASGAKSLSEVSASAVGKYMEWAQRGGRNSARTAYNKFLVVLKFLRFCGHVPKVGMGKDARPLGLRDAPRYVEQPVSIYSPDELAKFLAACGPRETAIFEAFLRAGLREQELATLRRGDCHLDGADPKLEVCERPDFIPKAYEIRSVSIDPDLASILRSWLSSHDSPLAFPSASGKVDGHLLRLCKSIAKRAKLDPADFWLHKFRATYATFMLRRGVDLETLRSQMGHRDTESLRRYLTPLQGEERAAKVAEAFKAFPILPTMGEQAATATVQ
jgi:integrase